MWARYRGDRSALHRRWPRAVAPHRRRARTAGDRQRFCVRVGRCCSPPEWLTSQFEASFGADAAADEGRALAERAPVDLRVNLLEDHPRQGARGACPSRAAADAALAGGLAHRHAPGRAGAAAGRPTRPTSRASSRCRTRARSSPRSWPKPSLACRSSTFAPGQAARRSRSPPRWTIRARSTPPTQTRTALDADLRPARALGRPQRAGAGAEGARRTCLPISKGAAIW